MVSLNFRRSSAGISLLICGCFLLGATGRAEANRNAYVECHAGSHQQITFYRYKPKRCVISDEFGTRRVVLYSMKWKNWNQRGATGLGRIKYFHTGYTGRVKVRFRNFEGGCGKREKAHQFAIVKTLSGPLRGDEYEYLLSPGPICSALR